MFDWVGDLIDGIGDAIGDAISAVFKEISGAIWDMMLKWIYTAIYDAIAEFFTSINNLTVEMFDLDWIKACVELFRLFGWALFLTGLVVAIFDTAIEAQSGRVNVRETAINCIKGFMAVNLITVVPIELYKFCVSLQNTFAKDLVRIFAGQQSLDLGDKSMNVLQASFSIQLHTAGIFNLLAMIALAYCVIKVFFSNIKRGGILLVQMAVGSFYMFSVPRGYTDGFNSWCKQIFGLCLTSFMQTTLLFLGLMTFSQNMILGLGIMLSANEVPRIAGQFGLETSVKGNMMSAVYATQSAINITRTVAKVGVK